MSNIAPLFSTAPRLKLRIGNSVVAYAVGFNVSVTVNNVPVRTIGDYAVLAIEPVLYNGVRGTLQILELKPVNARTALVQNAQTLVKSDLVNTNQVTTVDTVVSNNGRIPVVDSGSILNQQGLSLHLDPAKVLLSSTFDIDVYIKYVDSAGIIQEVPQFTARDCRLTSRNVNITAGSLIDVPFNFIGNLFVDHLRPGGQDAEERYDVGLQE